MLIDPNLERKIRSGEPFIEAGGPISGIKRKIPVGSYERIVELRLQEIFSILRERLDPRTCTPQLESGIVFCGGGSLIPAAQKNLREILGMQVRTGRPDGFSGAMTELEDPVRNASLLGLLKYVTSVENGTSGSGFGIGDALEDFGDNLIEKMKKFTKAFKI